MANEIFDKDTELNEEALETVSGGRGMYPEEKELFDRLVSNYTKHMRAQNKKGLVKVTEFDRIVHEYKRHIASLEDGSEPVMFDDYLRDNGLENMIFES